MASLTGDLPSLMLSSGGGSGGQVSVGMRMPPTSSESLSTTDSPVTARAAALVRRIISRRPMLLRVGLRSVGSALAGEVLEAATRDWMDASTSMGLRGSKLAAKASPEVALMVPVELPPLSVLTSTTAEAQQS